MSAAVVQSEEEMLEARDPKTVVAVILGGGAGTRLFPLTKRRAKPAVSARTLIDLPSSCDEKKKSTSTMVQLG